ncbi:MAG: hypothetical protein M1821_002922, partial [Bathelium mastoideum]
DETKNNKDDSSMNKPAGLSEKEFPPPLTINPPESNTSGPRIREGLRRGFPHSWDAHLRLSPAPENPAWRERNPAVMSSSAQPSSTVKKTPSTTSAGATAGAPGATRASGASKFSMPTTKQSWADETQQSLHPFFKEFENLDPETKKKFMDAYSLGVVQRSTPPKKSKAEGSPSSTAAINKGKGILRSEPPSKQPPSSQPPSSQTPSSQTPSSQTPSSQTLSSQTQSMLSGSSADNQGGGKEQQPQRKCNKGCGRVLDPFDNKDTCYICYKETSEPSQRARTRTIVQLDPQGTTGSLAGQCQACVDRNRNANHTAEECWFRDSDKEKARTLRLRPGTQAGPSTQPAPDLTMAGSTTLPSRASTQATASRASQRQPGRRTGTNRCQDCIDHGRPANHPGEKCFFRDPDTKELESYANRGIKGSVYPKGQEVSNPCPRCASRGIRNHTAENCRFAGNKKERNRRARTEARHAARRQAENSQTSQQQTSQPAPRPVEQLPLPEFQVPVSPSPNLNQAAEQQVTAEQQITASSSAAIARPASSHVASINPTPIVPQRWGQDVINDVNSRIHSARREHENLSILQATRQIYEQIVDEMLAPLESLSSEYPSFPVDEISERFRYIKELVRRAEEEFDKEGK